MIADQEFFLPTSLSLLAEASSCEHSFYMAEKKNVSKLWDTMFLRKLRSFEGKRQKSLRYPRSILGIAKMFGFEEEEEVSDMVGVTV